MKCFSSSTEEIEQKIHVHFNVHFYNFSFYTNRKKASARAEHSCFQMFEETYVVVFLHSYFSQLDLIEISP